MRTDGSVSVVRSRLAASAIVVLVCAVAAACADANQTITGGDLRFDAAVPAAPPFDGGPPLCFNGDASAGDSTWPSLYRDYFGGSATCSLNSDCHGTTSGSGYKLSHYLCPSNDPAACYAGITSPEAQFNRFGAPDNLPLVNVGNPEGSGLFKVLRKVNGDPTGGANRMPQMPTCYFSEADMSRILTWMRNGAKPD
jgi:hypothetical protein